MASSGLLKTIGVMCDVHVNTFAQEPSERRRVGGGRGRAHAPAAAQPSGARRVRQLRGGRRGGRGLPPAHCRELVLHALTQGAYALNYNNRSYSFTHFCN